MSEDREYTFTRFDQICAKYPDNTAIVYLGEGFSYATLSDLIDRFATGLDSLGVGKGDFPNGISQGAAHHAPQVFSFEINTYHTIG